jgi:xanthine dehydrogenase accessory factor
MRTDLLQGLLGAIHDRRPVVLATRMPSGEQTLLFPLDAAAATVRTQEAWPMDAARETLLDDRSTTFTDARGDIFLRPYNPPVRLVIVGAVHIAAPLVRMAVTAGLDAFVVDPRDAFASEERFPGCQVIRTWPEEALTALDPDHRTAVVTLTHDAKLDDPALLAALRTPAFYVGALGSRRTHAKRLKRLKEKGLDDDAIARIRAPIGLDIGARTPAEIAVAILAEVVESLRRRPEA